MLYAIRFVPESGEPQPVGTAEGSGDSAALDAFRCLCDEREGNLPAGEYQYRPMEQGGIPGVLPSTSIGPDWAPLILDTDGTISL